MDVNILPNHDRDANSVSNPSDSHQISSLLFEKGRRIPGTKILEFSDASQEFQFSTFYEYKGGSTPSLSQRSRTFKVDIPKIVSNKSIPVRVEISIDLYGMIVVKSASQPNSVGKIKGRREITWKLRCNEMLPIGMSNVSLSEAKESERHLLRHDKYVDEVQGQKNDLESFIYSTRKEVNGRYEEYAKKTERERILKKLDALETWLSENDDPEDESVSYSKELNALRKLVNPIESRYKYFLDCTEMTKNLHISITELDGVLTSKKLAGYYNMYSDWVSAVSKLQRLLPKDIEHLPVLLEKIRQMKKLTEDCKTLEDFHQIVERSASLFRDANNDSLSDCHGSEQKKKEQLPFVQEICTRLSDLLQNTTLNSAGANETPNETTGSLFQKEQDNHLDNLGTSSSVPSKMLDLKQDELKVKPDPSSSELKREQEDIKPERTAEEKESIISKIFDIQLELSERYGDFVPRLDKEEIDKKLHEIKNCLHHLGDDEVFYQQIHELRMLLARVEENYRKEENTGQRRAGLLYMIFDSRVKIMCIASYKSDVAGNQEFIRLVERAKYVCDKLEKKFEEVKSQDTLPCEKECFIGLENHLKRLQQEIQQFEDTVIEKTKSTEATLALQNRLLDIEKKVFGRYRYVVQSVEKKNISKIIKGIRHSLQQSEAGNLSSFWLKEKLQEMENVISTLEGRYEENKSKILDAAVELCDCIFELSRTAKSKRIPSFNLIKKRCEDVLKWLDRNYQIPNITTISEIKRRKDALNAYWEDIERSNFRMDSLERNDARNQPIRMLPRGIERIGSAIRLGNRT